MARGQFVVHLLVFGAGLAVGATWLGHRRPADAEKIASPATPVVTTSATSNSPASFTTSAAPTPPNSKNRRFLVVRANGNVSAELDDVPAAWVLDELGRQNVVVPGTSNSLAQPLEDPGVDEIEPAPSPQAQDRLIATLRTGAEADRFAALTRALDDGLEVPADALIATFDAALSDRLDLLAFSTYVDQMAGDTTSAREALERGRNSNSTVVRAEAARRLAEYERLESLAQSQAGGQ